MIPKNPANRDEVETLTELVARWKKTVRIYAGLSMKEEYGPEQKLVAATMARQLQTCINELEKAMYKDPVRMALAQSILKSSKEK